MLELELLESRLVPSGFAYGPALVAPAPGPQAQLSSAQVSIDLTPCASKIDGTWIGDLTVTITAKDGTVYSQHWGNSLTGTPVGTVAAMLTQNLIANGWSASQQGNVVIVNGHGTPLSPPNQVKASDSGLKASLQPKIIVTTGVKIGAVITLDNDITTDVALNITLTGSGPLNHQVEVLLTSGMTASQANTAIANSIAGYNYTGVTVAFDSGNEYNLDFNVAFDAV